MKRLTYAALARALHDRTCTSRCDHSTGHWRTQLDTAKAALTAPDPARVLHERTCLHELTGRGCPRKSHHIGHLGRWLVEHGWRPTT